MATIRRFTFLKRREGLSREEFHDAWRAAHRANGQAHVHNEVQPPVGELVPEPLWDGLLEAGPDAREAFEGNAFAALSGEADGIADPAQVVEFLAEARIVLDGPARGIKILSLPRRRGGLSPAEFSRHYRQVHGALVARNAAFVKYANRYVQHHVLPDSVRATGGFVPYDGISEFWFDSLDHARAAWDDPSYMVELRADEKNFVGSPPSHRLLVRPVEP